MMIQKRSEWEYMNPSRESLVEANREREIYPVKWTCTDEIGIKEKEPLREWTLEL